MDDGVEGCACLTVGSQRSGDMIKFKELEGKLSNKLKFKIKIFMEW